ncbi:hypothetical protein K438DRAFT_1587093 [Mycena galopus ATCC 62051]|nr:hypothetical protein K438DRAFT_1587093 [Mycena galopus ATCC 62051]
MIYDLVALKVPAKNVDTVIHTVGHGLGHDIQDYVSARHINWVVEEGGITSDLQVTAEIRESKAFGTSRDGTTIRHINFEAKHATYIKAGKNTPVTRMLNITSAPNHTSTAQLAGWKETIQYSLVDTYNASPLGQADPIDLNEFITWLKSLGTDHANDQKLLTKMKNQWIINSHKIMLGKVYLATTDLQTYLPEIQ